MSALVGIQVSTKHGIQPTYELSFALQYTVDGELHKKHVRTGRDLLKESFMGLRGFKVLRKWDVFFRESMGPGYLGGD
jgi:very-short-patch-repair endonuclease